MTRRRRLLLLTLIVGASLLLSLGAGEWILRAQTAHIQQSDQMDPGLIEYDGDLGWHLARNWVGHHRHYDFDVLYATDERGFRRVAGAGAGGRRVAFLGDSFTFGLGVGQGETFVERWAQGHAGPVTALNYGVPGTSTDQQVLLLEQRVLNPQGFGPRPDVVVLVVCLINDLFDNLRAIPLQAPYPKPYFELREGVLTLQNVPVPRDRKPDAAQQGDLSALIAPDGAAEPSGLTGWLGRRELCRRLGLFQPRFELPAGYFDGRYAKELALFEALVLRARARTEARGARFVLALLAGRSFVEEPEGWSAAFQEHLRTTLLARGTALGLTVVDLAGPLRQDYQASKARYFHPHEGHLNAEGHRKVAEALKGALR